MFFRSDAKHNKNFWSSPAAVVFFLALALFLASGTFRIIVRLFEIRRERQALEKKISELTAEKQRLRGALRSAESPGTIEKMAKEKLNLKNPKEEVVIVTPLQSAVPSGGGNVSIFSRFFTWLKSLVSRLGR